MDRPAFLTYIDRWYIVVTHAGATGCADKEISIGIAACGAHVVIGSHASKAERAALIGPRIGVSLRGAPLDARHQSVASHHPADDIVDRPGRTSADVVPRWAARFAQLQVANIERGKVRGRVGYARHGWQARFRLSIGRQDILVEVQITQRKVIGS